MNEREVQAKMDSAQQVRFSRSMDLFAMPTFLRGFAHALDLGGVFCIYNASRDEATADKQALLSDWQQVGSDLAGAMEKFEHEEVKE